GRLRKDGSKSMTRLKELATRMIVRVAILAFAILFLSQYVLAQLQRRAQGAGTQATQPTLSGRTGQTGSVTSTASPVPGATTSVNTINPTVQIQGPYSGSALSTTKIPFSGRLSLREAVERAMQYNLGA